MHSSFQSGLPQCAVCWGWSRGPGCSAECGRGAWPRQPRPAGAPEIFGRALAQPACALQPGAVPVGTAPAVRRRLSVEPASR